MIQQSFIYIYFLIIPILVYYATTSLIKPIKEISLKLGFFDKPDDRKLHPKNLVRLGGISIYAGFFIGLLLILIGNLSGLNFEFNNFELNFISSVLIGSSIFFLLGTIDDLFRISPFIRLIIEFLTVLILIYKGLIFSGFNLLPFASITFEINLIMSILINIIWITGITNAINWLDGMDGLTAFYIPIILSTLFIISISKGLLLSSLIILILIFSILGFYKHNKYPAKIIMGDGGTYFLGFILSTFTVFLSSYKGESYSIIIPIVLLSVPILDMIYVIYKRFINSKSIFLPDRSHLHHRLQDSGMAYRNTLNLIISSIIVTSSIGLILYFFI